MKWTLFCRVVDNLGDIGVCWRLAADLATRGEQVNLWVDDPSALAWMAPDTAPDIAPNVQVQHWTEAVGALPGDVVIEAFGCNPPDAFVQAMAAMAMPPVWINLEYLSAEPYVERNHRLPSPQPNGLIKWFFYPGFTAGTGGLLREPGLIERRAAFDGKAWLAARATPRHDDERVVSLFCYENPAVPALIDALAAEPTLLLVTPGPAARSVNRALGSTLARGSLRAVLLPWLSQCEFDHLLWACDLNFVRGEDSFVRAQWAGQPFVWQAYPQADGVHARKIDAFLSRHLHGAPDTLASDARAMWAAWNEGLGAPALPPLAAWRAQALAWRDKLLAQPDLATRLLGFVSDRRGGESS